MKKEKRFNTPFAAALEKMLSMSGVTQEEVARAVGYTNQNSISAIIKERTDGSEEKRRAIANYFGYLYDDFLAVGKKIIAGDLGYLDYAMIVIHTRVDKAELAKEESSAQIRDSIKKALIPSPTDIPISNHPPPVINLQDEADKKHQIVIEGFKDKELAIKFNQVLVEIEELDADDFKELYENAINKLNKLREKKGLSGIQKQKTGTNQL